MSSLINNLSIKVKDEAGIVAEVLPEGVELKYKLSYESRDLERSVEGSLIEDNRIGKAKLTVEGLGFIPDLLRQCYLNSSLEVVPGVRLYSMSNAPEHAEETSVIQKQNSCSYRLKLKMMMTHFSCEHHELDLSSESASKWKLVLEEV